MTAAGPSAREDLLQRAVAWFAEHGVGDTSLRTLAAGIGTSHRMLNYHFGSREDLLGAVIEAVEHRERDTLARFLAEAEDPYAGAERFWAHLADAAQTFAPLYFELSGHAMRGEPYAAALRDWLGTGWSGAMTALWRAFGYPEQEAEVLARVNLATVRGLLFELALTGDRAAADAAMSAMMERFRRRP
jgi:AcrR family transcriptional regulator